MIALVADASRDVLEAPLCDEAEPSCGVALALQLFALAVLHHLALALAKLAQHLDVNAIFPEFLFHCSCPKIGRGYGLFYQKHAAIISLPNLWMCARIAFSRSAEGFLKPLM